MHCNKEIVYLTFREDGITEFGRYTLETNGRRMTRETDDSDYDNAEIHYYCPECSTEIVHGYDEAQDFLKGKFEKVRISKKLKKELDEGGWE
jgi:hypothetical protein